VQSIGGGIGNKLFQKRLSIDQREISNVYPLR
jgi:hypothetical protein